MVCRDLILGGTGFLGSHLAAALVSAGHDVTVVGRKSRGCEGARVVQCDLYQMGSSDLATLLAGAGTVYHLAWSSLPASAEADPGLDLHDNVGFMVRLLAAIRGSNQRLVFVSSGGAVYGPSLAPSISEDHPLRPISAYGAGKAAAETYAGLYRDGYGLDVRIARLANPFGPGQALDRMQGALARFLNLALKGRPIEIWGDGEVIRDYIDVRDAVKGLRDIAEADLDGSSEQAIFNIGRGEGASLNDLIDLIEEALDRRLDVVRLPPRSIDVPRNVLSIARAERRLGWAPRFTLEQGLHHLAIQLRR